MSWLLWLKDFLVPPLCAHCNASGAFLCQNCYEQISFLFSGVEVEEKNSVDRVISLSPFIGPVRSLLMQLKYQGIREIAHTLAELLFHCLVLPEVDLITCVPAHRARLQQRGFNQAALIGKALAKLLEVPFLEILQRNKQLSAQASIANKELRKSRQQQTMACLPDIETQLPSKKKLRILLIDDVYTTGATLQEAARAIQTLRGVSEVVGLTVAHA